MEEQAASLIPDSEEKEELPINFGLLKIVVIWSGSYYNITYFKKEH